MITTPKYMSFATADINKIVDWTGTDIIKQISLDKEEIVQLEKIESHNHAAKDIVTYILYGFYKQPFKVACSVTNQAIWAGGLTEANIFYGLYEEINKVPLSPNVRGQLITDMKAMMFSLGVKPKTVDDFVFMVAKQAMNSFSDYMDFKYADSGLQSEIANNIPNKAQLLPGMDEGAICPVGGCPNKDRLYYQIQHLNDLHRWSREKIADWLDELADSGKINIDFSPWEDTNEQDR